MSSKENIKLNPSKKNEKKKFINTKNIFQNKQKQNRLKNYNHKKSTYVLKLSKKTDFIVSPTRKIAKKPIINISLKNSNYNSQISPNIQKRKINNNKNKKLSISNILNTNQILYRNKDNLSYKKQNKTSNSLYKSKKEHNNNSFNKNNISYKFKQK